MRTIRNMSTASVRGSFFPRRFNSCFESRTANCWAYNWCSVHCHCHLLTMKFASTLVLTTLCYASAFGLHNGKAASAAVLKRVGGFNNQPKSPLVQPIDITGKRLSTTTVGRVLWFSWFKCNDFHVVNDCCRWYQCSLLGWLAYPWCMAYSLTLMDGSRRIFDVNETFLYGRFHRHERYLELYVGNFDRKGILLFFHRNPDLYEQWRICVSLDSHL